MWVNLKTHFKAADQYQRLNITAKDAGYSSATNAARVDQFEDAHKQQVNEWATINIVFNTAAALVRLV